MPIFDFEGLLAKERARQKLVLKTEDGISSIESPNIKPEHIFPRVHNSKHITQKNPGELVTVAVRELFTVGYDEKPRTKKERRNICEALKSNFKQFVAEHTWEEDEVRPKTLVIFISMRDRAEYEYDSCAIPDDNDKCSMHGSLNTCNQ